METFLEKEIDCKIYMPNTARQSIKIKRAQSSYTLFYRPGEKKETSFQYHAIERGAFPNLAYPCRVTAFTNASQTQ